MGPNDKNAPPFRVYMQNKAVLNETPSLNSPWGKRFLMRGSQPKTNILGEGVSRKTAVSFSWGFIRCR